MGLKAYEKIPMVKLWEEVAHRYSIIFNFSILALFQNHVTLFTAAD